MNAYLTWERGLVEQLERDGTLTFNFVQELVERQPFYVIRLLGGVIFLAGMILMAVNVYKTIRGERDTSGADNVLQTA